jgi:hypothetical protein
LRLAYFRSADRRQAQRDALQDCHRIADLCESPAGYAFATTGIRQVRMIEIHQVVDKAQLEVWEIRFNVEWQQPDAWVVTPDPTLAPLIGGGFMFTVSTLAALAAHSVIGMASGSWLAFVEETQREYRLRDFTGTSSNGSSLISAPDGRQWVLV